MADDVSTASRIARRLIPGAAALLLLPALVPWWVVVLPRLDFDVDPRSPGADMVTTLGPGGFGILAVAGTLAAVFALVVHGLAGGGFAWKSAALLLPGLILVAFHMPARFENLWHGTGWAWGVAAGLAMLHLGQWPQARRWASAVLAGFAAMLLVEAMNYRFVEHAATVASFEQQRDVFLESRGWAVGSSEAQLYERRLRTNDAIGAIGLSNVLATLGAGIGAMALGLLVGSLRPRRGASGGTMAKVSHAARETFGGDAAGRWLVGGALFVVAAALVALTNSSAGMAALGLGCAWVTAVAVLRVIAARPTPGDRHPRAVAWCGAIVAAGCVALVYVGVAVRYAVWGVPGPGEVGQGIGGERSVLFRAQYWGAAWRMLTDSAGYALFGVGPGGFGDAYLRFKSPLNPEEVTSAHGFAVDFIATLGVIGGGLWAVVLVGWLARGAWGVMREVDPAAAPQPRVLPGLRGAVYGLLAIGGLLVAIEIAVAWAEISGPGATWGLAWRLAALGAFVLIGGLWWRFADECGVRVGLVAAAVAVLVHGSFDMAFFQPTSAVLMWFVVGLAGATCDSNSGARMSKARIPLPVLVSVGILIGAYVMSALLSRYSEHLRDAAEAARSGQNRVAFESLKHANRTVNFDPAVVRSVSQVAPSLDAASEFVQWSMVRRLPSVSAGLVLDQPWSTWRRVNKDAEVLGVGFGHAGSWRLLAAFASAQGDLGNALAARNHALERSPFNVRDHVALGDLLRERDEPARAADSYREALRLDDLRYLDPAKQLPEAERARIEAWLAEHDADG
ncbi:MAG: O-antigen ligase family protein [Planctomycetota bacterium]